MTSAEKKPRTNEQIKVSQVRLVDAEGEQVGVVSIQRALEMAHAATLDLVEVSPNADPPVCRIMDFGKYLFELRKRKGVAKKKQRQVHLKEIKLRPVTGEADFQVKLRSAIRFLEEGDKVKVTMRYRGREVVHQEIGQVLLNRFRSELEKHGTIEQETKMEGKQMTMVMGPKSKKTKTGDSE